MMPTWNSAFELIPDGEDPIADGDDDIRSFKEAVRERTEKEHVWLTSIAADGWHKQGSAIVYYGASAPTTRPDGLTALDASDYGRGWLSSADWRMRYYGPSGWVEQVTSSNVYGSWDLVIDSNADFDLWCQNTTGSYPRVYIKAGTWTASALSPTAGVLVNLTAAGTVEVYAEQGSRLVYSGSAGESPIIGLYRAAFISTAESYTGLDVRITSTSTDASCYQKLRNLTNCTGKAFSSNSVLHGRVFDFCYNLHNCHVVYDEESGDTITCRLVPFFRCNILYGCSVYIVDGSTNNGHIHRGFSAVTNATNCHIYIGSDDPSGIIYGARECLRLTGCVVTTTGRTTEEVYSYYYCTGGLVNCSSTQAANSGAGVGYGFYGCRKVQQCSSASAKTAAYYASYADAGTVNACADTADGGYNS